MKKFLSLIMVAAMLVAVFAMVGCDDPVETTTASTTTAATTTTASTPAETTTSATTPAETTTTATEPIDTTTTASDEPVDTTTTVNDEPTTTTTVAPPPSTTGSTVPVFARFDFGTATKAEAEGKTSHAYLTSALTYNESNIALVYTEDTVVVYAKANATSSDGKQDFALRFEDIVTFDFDDELMNGWGGFGNGPLNPNNTWHGRHQFVKFRMRNFTTNNVMSIEFMRSSDGGAWYTTTIAGHMYLQGGPSSGKTATVNDEWKIYTYDMAFQNSLTRSFLMQDQGAEDFGKYTNVVQGIQAHKDRGNYFIQNWGSATTINGIRFGVLGAYDPSDKAYGDTRTTIKMGAKVEIDYIVFGSSLEQLQGYTSYIEDAANAAA